MADTLLQRHTTAHLIVPKAAWPHSRVSLWPGRELGGTYPPSSCLSHFSCPHPIQVPEIWGTDSTPLTWGPTSSAHMSDWGPATFQGIGQTPPTKSLVHLDSHSTPSGSFLGTVYSWSPFAFLILGIPDSRLKDCTYFPFILFDTPRKD